VDIIIDIIFGIDIIVNFRTSYYNKVGEEVLDSWDIAYKYMMGGRFLMDFLASFPFDKVI
jgi:hypothetical protein